MTRPTGLLREARSRSGLTHVGLDLAVSLVEPTPLPPRAGELLTLVGLRQDLGDLLGVAVDVVAADSLEPDRARSILDDAVPL